MGAYSALQRDVQQRIEQKAQQELAAERQKLQQALQLKQQARLTSAPWICIWTLCDLLSDDHVIMVTALLEAFSNPRRSISCCEVVFELNRQPAVQGESELSGLRQQLQQQQAEVERLRAELAQERASKQHSTSHASALEKQLHEKSSALVRHLLPVSTKSGFPLCLASAQ